MNCMRLGRSGLAILALGVLSACASNPVTVLPDDTLLLGEVSGVLTRGLPSAGRLSEGDPPRDLSRLLQNRGWTDEQLDGGRVLQEGGCYYGNVPVGPVVELLAVPGMVGARGSASLYCRGIERERWQSPRTLLHRLPGAAALSEGFPLKPPSEVPLPK